MDSGNSGSISSSGDEEYDSHAHPSFLNHPNSHFGSISHAQSPLVDPSHPPMFDLSSAYLRTLPQSQPNQNPHSLLNLDPQAQRSEPNYSHPTSLPSSSDPQPSSLPITNNVVRNSKKRSRASRRAPTTVLTTDTTNFRSMVQEFTGIPAPPFSSYSRRPNPLLSTPRTLLHNNINMTSPNNATNNSINYQLPPDLSLPYHNPHNIMQNHPTLAFQSSPPLHTLLPAKSLPMPSFDDDVGVSHGHVNVHMMATTNGISGHEHVASENMPLRSAGADACRDPFRSLDGNYGSCKLNISSSVSSGLNHHEKTLENVSPRGEGAVDAWICSSDQ
ncbi:uncharacterized protein LOC113867064 [Abrus precatorius]|uniref:Uncharacterized protein LOC113867064 n=1 Tax=Abrus precatorius TaxID=3816 RepID=A0A8B8LPM2_ABRPR|nr:uncharacterized protein LOC113867064 [Abrus precatorius]